MSADDERIKQHNELRRSLGLPPLRRDEAAIDTGADFAMRALQHENRLKDALADALRDGKSRFDAAVTPEELRAAVSLQLAYLFRWMSYQGLREQGDPLRQLSIALKSLDNGAVEPVLSPSKKVKGGRPPMESERRVRSHAVMAANALINSGMAPSDADGRIARRVRDLGLKLRSIDRVTETTIAGWRKLAREDPAHFDQTGLEARYGREEAESIVDDIFQSLASVTSALRK